MSRPTMKELEHVFKDAMDRDMKYIAIAVQTRGVTMNEVIINPMGNYETKLEYYKKAYDDRLVLKAYDGIRIVGVESGHILSDFKHMFRSGCNE